MSLAPGQTIDRYVVERRIGRGGMAEVFAVRHRLLGTRHALKVLLDASEDLRERLLREGRVQASLDHPNVVPVRDVFDVEGAPALLLPFVSGPSLSELIGAGGFEVEDALALFRAVVTGVAFVHAHGLVHRDVKASNVLVEIRPDAIVPRVADFGLVTATDARFDQELTRHGIFVGTLRTRPRSSCAESARWAHRSTSGRSVCFSTCCSPSRCPTIRTTSWR